MALITCPACGKQVSEKAVSCPYCGQPIADLNPTDENYQGGITPNSGNEEGNKNILIVFLTVLAIALAVILYLVAGKGCSSTSSENSDRATQVVDTTKAPANATDNTAPSANKDSNETSRHSQKKSNHAYPPPTREMTLERMFRDAPPEARK